LETSREYPPIARKMSDEPTEMPIIRKTNAIAATFVDDVVVARVPVVDCDAEDAGSDASVSMSATKANAFV
jgi:hypothetical protein